QVTLDELRPTPEPGVELQGTGAALDQLPRPRRVDGPRALLPEPPARQPGDDSFDEIKTVPATWPLHD
ncbi:MAG: hypothetical protein IT429_03365, partial [Gemmataceae bacterium]|nr:hypothetical protein [Gemmataceae bacterium]